MDNTNNPLIQRIQQKQRQDGIMNRAPSVINQTNIQTEQKLATPLIFILNIKYQYQAKIIRHEMAIEKYKIYETQKLNGKKIGEMMRDLGYNMMNQILFYDFNQGEKQVDFIQKPGEFFVLSSTTLANKSDKNNAIQLAQQSMNSSKMFANIIDNATRIYEGNQNNKNRTSISNSTSRQRILSTNSQNSNRLSSTFYINSNTKTNNNNNTQQSSNLINLFPNQNNNNSNVNKIQNQTFHITTNNNIQQDEAQLPSIQITEPNQNTNTNKQPSILRSRRSQSMNKLTQPANPLLINSNNNNLSVMQEQQSQIPQLQEESFNMNEMQSSLQQQQQLQQRSTTQQSSEKKGQLTKNIKIILQKQEAQMLINSSKLVQEIVQENLNITDRMQTLQKRMNTTNGLSSFRQTSQSFITKPKISSGIGGDKPPAAQLIISQIKQENVNKLSKSIVMRETLNSDRKQDENSNRKKNERSHSYQILQRTQVKNKHISGHQTVVINHKQEEKLKEEQRLFKEELKKKQTSKIIDYSKISPYIVGDDDAEKKINADYGYNNILDEQNIAVQKKQKSYFLPLDYYNLDEEDLNPEELLKKYYNKETQSVQGYSKWFLNDGNFSWEQCTILEYNALQERYSIQWRNGKQKLVSRVNLRFEGESVENFEKKLEIASVYREISEYYIKYNLMIDTMEDETTKLQDEIMDRMLLFATNHPFKLLQYRNPITFYQLHPIVKFNFKVKMFPQEIDINNTQNFSLERVLEEKKIKIKSLNLLKDEVKQLYVRTNRQITFDNQLPFSEEKQKYFKGILPDYMFIPITEREKDNPYYATLDIGYPQNHHYTKFLGLVK